MAAGYRGYDPTAIPKRFQLREGFSFGGIGDFVAVLKEHAEVKISAAKEGVQTAFTKVGAVSMFCVLVKSRSVFEFALLGRCSLQRSVNFTEEANLNFQLCLRALVHPVHVELS